MTSLHPTVSHVAAYGTLRSNHENHTRSGMAAHVTSAGIHRIPGRMYAVPNTGYAGVGGANYPGAILSDTHETTIEIELFTITGDLMSVITLLDEFENDNPADPEYRRTIITVNGVDAYIYEYLKPVENLPEVTSGIWQEYVRQAHGHATLRYSRDCDRWVCPACGVTGLDGDESPNDYPCV